MALFDLPLSELRTYRPERVEPPGFGAFWEETLAGARAHGLNVRLVPASTPLRTLEAFDLTFAGFGGQDVRGWLILPARREGRLPCVVEFLGYGGGRGHPTDWLTYASCGYAHLVMDTRGQGGGWRRGDTPDHAGEAGLWPQHPGFLTRGLGNPRDHYYRRLMTDAVRAVDAALTLEAVDPARVAVAGESQGGGLALAAAGLHPGVGAALPDVPFLCHFGRAVEITDAAPYVEVANYCRVHRQAAGRVLETLAHFDGLHFAARATCPALFSVGLMDPVCPPSTVFAAYHHYAGPGDIRVYPFNRHEGGQGDQALERLAFLGRLWNLPGGTPDPGPAGV